MKCIEKIKASAKKLVDDGVLTDGDIDALFDALQKIRKRNRSTVSDIDNYMLDKANKIVDDWVLGMKIEKRNQALNLLARGKAMEWMANWKEANPTMTRPFAKARATTDADALEAYLVGFKGGGDSIAGRMKSKENGIMASVVSELQEGDLFPLLNSRQIDRDIAKEMWELHDKGKPGITGNAEALKIAKIMHKHQEAVVKMQNDVGAWIEMLPGYIVKQAHDSIQIRNAGRDAWIAKINDKLDWDRMAPHLDAAGRLKYLTNVYDNLSTGMHHVSKGAENSERFLDLSDGFKGPANLAKKISGERVLHFKSADDWFDYNAEFGGKNISEAFIFGIQRGVRNAALMEGLGTNPKAMYDTIVETLVAKNKDKDPKAVARLMGQDWQNGLKWYYDELSGEINRPGSSAWAVAGSGARAVQSFSKLGGAVLSSVSDIVAQIATLRNNNVGWGEAVTAPFRNLSRGRGYGDRELRDALSSMGVGVDGIMGYALARWGAADHVPGRLNSLVQQTFKFTGMNWWTDAHKAGVGLTLSNHLAKHKKLSWDALNEDYRRVLSQYIDAKEWDLIRSFDVKTIKGDDLILPEGAQRLTDDQVKKALGKPKASARQIRMFKDDLENKLRNYFVDQGEIGVPTPGAKERALLRFGTNPGTITGEIIRSMMQFKAFPVTFISKTMGQFFRNGQANYTGLAQLFIMSTMMGYVAMTLKDLAKNRSPRDPLDARTWLAAAQQGGGIGIYGDFLFGEANRFGGGLVATLAGPTAGSIEDLAEIIQTPFALARGDDPKIGTKVLNFFKNHSPYINFFYARGMMDYLIFHQLQEGLNPGYLRRMRNRVERENQQETIIMDPLGLYD